MSKRSKQHDRSATTAKADHQQRKSEGRSDIQIRGTLYNSNSNSFITEKTKSQQTTTGQIVIHPDLLSSYLSVYRLAAFPSFCSFVLSRFIFHWLPPHTGSRIIGVAESFRHDDRMINAVCVHTQICKNKVKDLFL